MNSRFFNKAAQVLGRKACRAYTTKAQKISEVKNASLFSEEEIQKEMELAQIRQRVYESGILNGTPPINVNDLSESALRSWDETLKINRNYYAKTWSGLCKF